MLVRVAKGLKRCLQVGLIFAVVVIIGVGIRLAVGPVEVGFLRPSMEQGLNDQLGDYSVTFDKTILIWDGWDRGLDVRATDVELKDHRGLVIAKLSQVSVGLEASDLLGGDVTPERIILFEPTLSISRRADGSFGFRRDDKQNAASQQLTQGFLAALMKSDDTQLGRLKRIAIIDARLEVGDLALEQDWTVENLSIGVERTENGIEAIVGGALIAGERMATLDAVVQYRPDPMSVTAEVDVGGFVPSILARRVGPFSGAKGLDVPINGSVRLIMSGDARIDSVTFEVEAGEGTVNIDALNAPIQVKNAKLAGSLDRNVGRLDISNALVQLDDGKIAGNAAIYAATTGEGIRVAATIDDLSFQALARLWPPSVKAFTRNWFSTNVENGRIIKGDIKVDIQPNDAAVERPGSINFSFNFEGLELHYLRPMPPLSAASGTALLTENLFSVSILGGRIFDEAHDLNIDVKSVEARLRDLASPVTQFADVEVALSANVPQIIQLIDYQPLGYASDYGLSTTTLGGDFDGNIWLKFPLIQDIALADMDFRADAEISDFLILEGLGEWAQVPGQMSLNLDRDGIAANGRLFIEGQPLHVTWRESFLESVDPPTQFTIHGDVPASSLTRFGLPNAVVSTGRLSFDVQLEGSGVTISKGRMVANLTPLGLVVSALGWEKPEGEDGTLRINIDPKDGVLESATFSLLGQNASLSGNVGFANGSRDARIDIEKLILGANDVSASIDLKADAPPDIRVRGKMLDLRPVIGTLFEDGEVGFEGIVDVSVDAAHARQEVDIKLLNAILRFDDDGLTEAQMSAQFADDKLFFVNYYDQGELGKFDVQTENAGLLVKALDFYDGLAEGNLGFTGSIETVNGAALTRGALSATSFRITSAPALAQLLTLGSLSGLRDTLGGRGISFDRFNVDLEISDSDILIKEGHAVGSQLGIKIDGRVFDEWEQFELEGTLAPAYGINSIIGRVPVVGDVLMGGADEGLIAFRYSVDGPIDDPAVSVNPLSGLTPGFLRGIFDVFNSTPDASSSAPPEVKSLKNEHEQHSNDPEEQSQPAEAEAP